MKKIILPLLLALLCSMRAIAKAPKNTAITPLMKKSLDFITQLEDEQEQEVVHVEYDIIRNKKEVVRALDSKYTYGLIVHGDERISKLRLTVYKRMKDNTWKKVAHDDSGTDVAIISFKPDENGTYKFEIKADFQRDQSLAHYGFIIHHDLKRANNSNNNRDNNRNNNRGGFQNL